MDLIGTINAQIEKRGISVAELARRSGVTYEALRTTLEGERQLKAQELVQLCKALGLSLESFDK